MLLYTTFVHIEQLERLKTTQKIEKMIEMMIILERLKTPQKIEKMIEMMIIRIISIIFSIFRVFFNIKCEFFHF